MAWAAIRSALHLRCSAAVRTVFCLSCSTAHAGNLHDQRRDDVSAGSLADLERLEGPWLDGLATGDPEVAATTVRLLLAHLTWNSKRLLGAMVLDRMDAESLSTRAEFPDRCQRLVNRLD